MKRTLLFCFLTLPFLVFSQVAITFSDDFNLEEQAQYDNWLYQQNTFFVLPLSINDFIAIENYQFNIIYDPQAVQLDYQIIDDINQSGFTDSYNVLSALSGQQGSISAVYGGVPPVIVGSRVLPFWVTSAVRILKFTKAF